VADVFFRSPRGGNCPLDRRGRRELLSLYAGWRLSVPEIAEHFGVSTGTIYRWLMLLGVKPQYEATPAQRAVIQANQQQRRRRHAVR
jgi:transposase